jgi:hypothetical protein
MFRVTTNEGNFMNIKNKDYEMDSYFLGIDIWVRMTSIKDGVKKKVSHFGILQSRIMLYTIKIFLEAKNKARFMLGGCFL